MSQANTEDPCLKLKQTIEENHQEVVDKLSEMEEEMARCKRVAAQRKGLEEERRAEDEEREKKRELKNQNILDMMHLYMAREDERRKQDAMKAAATRAEHQRIIGELQLQHEQTKNVIMQEFMELTKSSSSSSHNSWASLSTEQ
ncbi:hypothetical protein CPB86DRAFT_778895 [Serendipita vermifera]|nr:hypothetical protein CPB86DRAFT_778895 [Serendipita vermifera]